MKFIIQQKFLSVFRNSFKITDEEENEIYSVKSNFFFPYKLTFSDAQQNEVLVIKKRYFRMLARYDVKVGKERIASIKRRFALFQKKFKIKSKNENLDNLRIVGDLFALSFEIVKEEDVRATVSKKFISIGDRYTVNINDEENFLTYLAIVVTLDDILHKNK